jgi:chitinase
VGCAKNLSKFVVDNNLDGVDIDWEDNAAMEAGTGEAWLISFQLKLRELLPHHIIAHAPQAPYFKEEFYRNGAYMTVHRQVGHTIDYYMVQFYNQGDTKYDSYEQLFTKATGGAFPGTSVKEIAARGVPLQKIVVGKPVVQADAANTGWVDQAQLGQWALRAYNEFGWYAGIGHWQFKNGKDGNAIKNAAGPLINACAQKRNCV